MQFIKKAARQLLDLLFPQCCIQCQKSGHILCPTCLAKIPLFSSPYCQQCCTPLTSDMFCRRCALRPLHINGLRVASPYQEPLRTYIHELKYRGNSRLSLPLGTLLARAFAYYRLQTNIIIPVPLHRERERQRGYNQAQLLAECCAARVNKPCHSNLLIRHRVTRAQVQLSYQERQHNMLNAFYCPHPEVLRGQHVLLIDDVSTTGATLKACATPLFQAGAREVWGLVLARPL